MRVYRVLMPLLAALLLGAALLACGQLGAAPPTAPAWTPPPAGSVQATSPVAEPAATAGETILPTVAPPAAPQPSRAAVPTQDPHHVVVTDSDITSSLAGDGLAQSGAQADNLAVRFRGGKTYVTANSVVYGPVNLQNLVVVGRLVARDGALQMDTESVEPQGLVSGMVPGIINQALKQYASRWYVEDVQTGEGQIELRIR